MRDLVTLFGALLVAVSAFAQANPPADVALDAAKQYVCIEAFANILDEDSSVSVVETKEDDVQYVFMATAKNLGLSDCNVEIKVSRATGLAFQDKIQECQNLSN